MNINCKVSVDVGSVWQLLDDIDYSITMLGYVDEESTDDIEIYIPQLRSAADDLRALIIEAVRMKEEKKSMKPNELMEMSEVIMRASGYLVGAPLETDLSAELEKIAERLREIATELREGET